MKNFERTPSNSKFQINALDGLRGVAAIIVVLSHTSNEGWFFLPYFDFSGTGKSGVYLFFLLSSFLLSLPLIEKANDSQLFNLSTMSNYWQRRFFRIYPLYSLYLLCALVTTFFLSFYFGLEDLGAPFPLTISEFLEHIFLLDGKGVTWSIAVEFKFYFVLPILIWFVAKMVNIGRLATFSTFLILFVFFLYVSPQSELMINDTRLLPYMPIFLIGILCAIVQSEIRKNPSLGLRFKNIFLILGCVGLVGIIITIPSVYSLYVGYSVSTSIFHKEIILVTVSWAFFMMFLINYESFLRDILCSAPLKLAGVLSFSLYLVHPVVIGVINFIELKGFEVNNYLSAWLVFIITVVVSLLTYKSIEEPCSKLNIGLFRTRDNKQKV